MNAKHTIYVLSSAIMLTNYIYEVYKVWQLNIFSTI